MSCLHVHFHPRPSLGCPSCLSAKEMSTHSGRGAELSTCPSVALGAMLPRLAVCSILLAQPCPHQFTRAFLEHAEVDKAEKSVVSKMAEDATLPLSRRPRVGWWLMRYSACFELGVLWESSEIIPLCQPVHGSLLDRDYLKQISL